MQEFQQKRRSSQKSNRDLDEDPIGFEGTKSGAHYNPVSSSAQDTVDDIDKVLAANENLAANAGGKQAEKDEAAKAGVDKDDDNPQNYTPPTADASQPKGFVGRLKSNRRALIGVGAGGGIVLSLVAGFIALLPLKLEMLIKTATEHAAEIPEYAIEHRLQYLTSRYLAHKVLGVVNPADSYPSTSLAGSLFKTWQANRVEDLFGIKIESNRTNNGQTATSWTITYRDGEKVTDRNGNLTTITHTIESSKEMDNFIRGEFKQKTKWYQFYKRLAVRKMLMRTKGVNRWAWILPDKWSEKLDSYTARKTALTTRIKVRFYEATIDKVMPRMGLYLACLSDGAVCKELHNKRFGTSLEAPKPTPLEIDCPEGDTACVEEQTKLAQEAADAESTNGEDVKKGSGEVKSGIGEETGKLISKELLKKISLGIGVVDTLASIVNGFDNGDINQIMYDKNSIEAAGYAADQMSVLAQWHAGQLDYEQIDAYLSQLGDYGSSPAWQAEIGILPTQSATASILGNSTAYAASAPRYERECGTDGEKTLLGPGETVCPERKIISDKTPFTSMTWWQPLAAFASTWVHGPGQIMKLFSSVTGLIGVDAAISKIMEVTHLDKALSSGFMTLLSMVFGSPISPGDTDAEAGDNFLGGIKATYFALGEAGQDTDTQGNDNGKGLGIGGGVFTPQQTAALKSQIAQEKQDEWSQKSAFAKLFDMSDTRSVLAQLVMRAPTNTNELAMFPSLFQSSVMGLINPQSNAAGPVKDQFGFDFNYGFTDAQLTADPAQYTPEKCAELAKEREASYTPGKDVDKNMPIYVYTKADPCALEKVVVAAGSAEYDQNYSPDFALDKANDPAPNGDTTNPGGSDSSQTPSAQGYIWPIPKSDYKPLSNCYRKAPNGHTGIDIPVPVGTKVYAASEGKVVRIDTSGGSDGGKYIIIQHANGYFTNYQHLSSISVKEGDNVTAGQNIGLSGNTGNSTGPHLHFSVTTKEGLDSRNSVAYSVNPIPFLPTDGRSLGVCG